MERNIFQYHNGEKQVYGDPMVLDRAIRLSLGDITALVAKVNSIDLNASDPIQLQEGFEAQETMAQALRDTFGMIPFDPETGKGATEPECFAVWAQFCAFLESKKKPPATSPTSGAATDLPPATPSATTTTSG